MNIDNDKDVEIYAFGSRWNEKSETYLNKCKNEQFAFAGVTKTYENTLIKKGDIILLKLGEKIKAVGVAVEDANKPKPFSEVNNYFTDEEVEKYQIDKNCLALFVKVDKWIDCDIIYKMGGFHKMNKSSEKNKERLQEIYSSLGIDSNVSIDYISVYSSKLLKSKNLILTGAPGTGKTYLAKKIAESIVLNGLSEDEIQNKKDKILKNQTAFVQFHPSFDYTDFVEGIKPNKDKSFERQDGIFKKFCKSALEELPDYTTNEDDIEEYDSQHISEYDTVLVEKLHKFIDDLQEECKNKPVKLKGFTGKDISPLTSVQCNNDKIIFTIKGSKSQEEKIKETSIPFFIGAYKRFIENDVDKYSTKLFVDHVRFWWSPTSFYGFIRKFYDKYNNDLKQITGSEYQAKKYVFIIDEINRGDLNKILGELFYALDPGYRGTEGSVQTQYINLIDDEKDPYKYGFYIPENVYIIGTMNDIDRSVDSMDFAVRRRFAWQEITYDMTADKILSNLENKDIITLAKERLDKLNNKINELLGSEYNIGASYFLKLNECDDFDDLWKNYLYGILFEYFRTYPKEDRDKYLNLFENIILGNNNEDN